MSILGLSVTEQAQPVVVGAGFWIRVLARLIDTVVGFILGRFAGYAGALVLIALQFLTIVRPGWPMRVAHERLLIVPFSLVGNLLYHTACEGIYGATPGKFFCGLRVLSEDLKPCDLKAGFIRSVAYFIDALVFGLVAWLEMSKSDAEQRHGDNWAHTVVVKSGRVPAVSKRSEFRLFGALVAGICAWGVMLIAGLVVAAL
jgi:uncharacterized RDD family membrane protein YckC